jgi:hypothetical protein
VTKRFLGYTLIAAPLVTAAIAIALVMGWKGILTIFVSLFFVAVFITGMKLAE